MNKNAIQSEMLLVSSFLCSKLCHDLVSPLGALSGGLDLMREFKEELSDEEMNLIFESEKSLALKLGFYRLAWGAAGLRAHDAGECVRSLACFLESKQVKSIVPEDEQTRLAALPQGWLWLWLNMGLISASALPEGGYIETVCDDETQALKITAAGEDASFRDETRHALSAQMRMEELSPLTAPARHGFLIARHLGQSLRIVEPGNGRLCLETSPLKT